jgi:hypothetical protein
MCEAICNPAGKEDEEERARRVFVMAWLRQGPAGGLRLASALKHAASLKMRATKRLAGIDGYGPIPNGTTAD